MKIQKFEEIKAWQEARILVNMVYDVTKSNTRLQRQYRFRDQLTSSATSIMANIAEGFSRHYNSEFIQFLFIAKASLAELQSHLYIAMDQEFITNVLFEDISMQIDKTARHISNFITYLMKHK